ncbi:extracellular solute-binding protein [Rubrobacter taiwanensis]|uniref:Extracellular solute-binding protein n=1 Tax=Rubrobacter taiwanensis TaxID=185139 RepID=A0A4R1BCZ7_9ACTN|nr:extracellular solute-binding protein [Rubrobacter taiwanensis]TCJ14877.1 extracellular solute-binding protein [Rubrobacter taiwanensis]
MKGRRISRRDFLKRLGAGAVAGSTLTVLSACTVDTAPRQGGDGGSEGGGTLNLYNWSDYVAETTIPGFEEEFGVRVVQDFYASNEELLAKLQAGGTGYDVIVPSDYMVEIMAKSGVIQELDMAKIPNFENVGENFRGLPYDPENRYSVPYQWGTTGILYDREEVGEVESWDAMWDERYAGRIAMIDDVRETIGAALMRLGYSINSTDEGELGEARELLLEQKPLLRGYFASTEIVPLVESGDVLLGHVFSGEGILATVENENLAYAIPKPAATRWTDNMCIPAGAPNPDLAHEFINYILDAQVGADLTNYTYYGTPNEAALPLIDEELTSIPEWNPPDEVFDRLQVIEDVGEATRDYERIFTEVKSA